MLKGRGGITRSIRLLYKLIFIIIAWYIIYFVGCDSAYRRLIDRNKQEIKSLRKIIMKHKHLYSTGEVELYPTW